MTAVFAFLFACVAIGMIARDFRGDTRFVLILVVAILVVYATVTVPSTLVLK